MNQLNLKGVTSETVTGVFILFIALINAILQMFGIPILPITNKNITNVISTVFLIITTLWNTWKNRNFSSASQIAQNITDSIKSGKLLEEDVKSFLYTIKSEMTKGDIM